MESRSGQGLRFVKRMIQQEIETASIAGSASFSTLCSDYCRIPWWIPSKWSYLDWLYPKSISSCVVHSLLNDIVSKVFQESFMGKLSTSKSCNSQFHVPYFLWSQWSGHEWYMVMPKTSSFSDLTMFCRTSWATEKLIPNNIYKAICLLFPTASFLSQFVF